MTMKDSLKKCLNNAGRKERMAKELKVLRQLPARRHDDYTEHTCKVGRFKPRFLSERKKLLQPSLSLEVGAWHQG